MPTYPVSSINIPVTAVFGENDSLCPAIPNQNLYQAIPDVSTQIMLGATNYDLIGSNNPTLLEILAGVEALVPDPRDICATPPQPAFDAEACYNKSGKEVSCKEGSDKQAGVSGGIRLTSEEKYMAKYDVLVTKMNDCVDHGVGSPAKIKAELDKICDRMERKGMDFDEPIFMINYEALSLGASEELA